MSLAVMVGHTRKTLSADFSDLRRLKFKESVSICVICGSPYFSQLISEGMVFSYGMQSFSSGQTKVLFAELAEIAGGLYVEPELGALLEEFAEFEGHFGREAGHVATACSLTSGRNEAGQFH
jgi:hypothetical protein